MKNETKMIVGKKINGSICSSSIEIGDMTIIWMEDGICKVFKKESIAKKAELYKIAGEEIIDVFIPKDHELVILKTKNKEHFRDFKNEPIKDAAAWADYYFEPFTASFYRKDERGNWYDIEGHRLSAPVFLKNNVLCSLLGKVSKKSMSFQHQEIVMSPSAKLIQVGKLVYDTQLEIVHYFGEKITGLGNKSIGFGQKDVLQEVRLGLKKYGFINEFSREPYLIDNEEVTGHVQTINKGHHRFEVFKSAKQKYIVENSSDNIFTFEGEVINLDFSTYLEIGKHELILAKKGRKKFFMEINYKVPFTLPGIEEEIISIDQELIKIGNDHLYNIKTIDEAFVYNETKNNAFTLNKGEIFPQALIEAKGFESHFAFAKVDGVLKLFSKKHNVIIQLGEEGVEVKEILSKPGLKLLNAIAVNDERIVIDARKGNDQLALAKSQNQKVVEVLDKSHEMGNVILQNALLQTLGGTEPRVIDLNNEQLTIFVLPENLKEYPGQETPSSFCSNPILNINFKNLIKIDGESFLIGEFLSFFGNVHSVILQQKSAKPLQLEGAGHRNELVIGFNTTTLLEGYNIGAHRMIGAYTLTEDVNPNELLFAIDTKNSWLSFYESFLPILKRVVEFKDETSWDYVLYELREVSKSVEYIAVEKNEPYRVLVEKKKGKPVPKIVKSKEKVLKTPEEISAIQKFFLQDPGYLMEVD